MLPSAAMRMSFSARGWRARFGSVSVMVIARSWSVLQAICVSKHDLTY
jgi:hypothetical protein